MTEQERVIYDRTGKRRVQIFRSDDGFFSFLEEKFSDQEFEQCWLPLTWRRSQPVCDTFETALREAKGRIEWLAEMLEVE
jgi:hypothetical protein